MSDLRTAALRALEALEHAGKTGDWSLAGRAFTTLKAALAEPVQPVQHEYEVTANDDGTFSVALPDGEELRIIPPQRPAQPVQEAVRCPLCNYQYGHQIGCENNPVDIALAAAPPQRPAERVRGPVAGAAKSVHDKAYSEVELASAYQKGWSDAMLRRRLGPHIIKEGT